MRTAWTPHAALASPLKGEAVVSGQAGGAPVTINQFPAVMVNAAMQSSAARRRRAYIVAWRRRFAPT
ncbi:hypothetical protein EAS54_06035 [Bradyrhizobium guangzhouense]|uniref:Uncharacterized protein n=1 Tax=Bradyrhizobium guangzhouense TaxID=1325095 RepID=A0AAE6CBL1_9BRAD|nr:hypothetical protein XH91_00875 [Bradyrhizobium guangzhouense]RXH11566.1 hypothetical protein EAS56_19605 [Bradyrhizobium guangzhouense]RXH19894.1 hypothetical protein EAS54_06035 [Bradyrhizobium guangzhouense]